MAVLGTALGGLIGAYGKKPEVPKLTAVNPTAIQSQGIAENAQDLPAAQQFGSQVNNFNIQEQLGMLSKALEFLAPGQLQKAQGIVSSQLNGEVPKDVMAQVQRYAAGKAFQGGYGAGSGIGRNLSARDFGLTSLGIQQQGMANFSALSSLAPKTQAFDVTSMFFTPQQRLQAAFQERNDQFNRNMLNEQVKAAPDPFAAAMGQAFIQDEQQIYELIGSVAGVAAKGAVGA